MFSYSPPPPTTASMMMSSYASQGPLVSSASFTASTFLALGSALGSQHLSAQLGRRLQRHFRNWALNTIKRISWRENNWKWPPQYIDMTFIFPLSPAANNLIPSLRCLTSRNRIIRGDQHFTPGWFYTALPSGKKIKVILPKCFIFHRANVTAKSIGKNWSLPFFSQTSGSPRKMTIQLQEIPRIYYTAEK